MHRESAALVVTGDRTWRPGRAIQNHCTRSYASQSYFGGIRAFMSRQTPFRVDVCYRDLAANSGPGCQASPSPRVLAGQRRRPAQSRRARGRAGRRRPCSTYARHRLRHGLRHTAARAGRRPRPSVPPNDCLRYMPIGSARVSKADGSQSLEVPAEQGAVLRRATKEFKRRVFLSTLNDIRNFCEAHGIEEPRLSKSRASGIPRVFKFLVTMDVADVEGSWMTGCSPDRPSSAPSQTPSEVRRSIATRRLITAERLLP